MTTEPRSDDPRPESVQPQQQTHAAPHRDPADVPGARGSNRTGPRTSPIVWGALILAFCGYATQRAFSPGGIDTAWWITATVIGLGVLLLAVGIAVAIRNRR